MIIIFDFAIIKIENSLNAFALLSICIDNIPINLHEFQGIFVVVVVASDTL